MANGLRIRDTVGNVKIDISDRLTRILGIITVGAPGATSNGEFVNGTPWAVILDPNTDVAARSQPMVPRFSGTTLLWEALQPGVPYRVTRIMYGLY